MGSAYTTIAADIISRWNRLNLVDTFFLTGLDENSSKTVRAAKEKGYQDVQKYADDMAKEWVDVWKVLNISYDGFIRTTSPKHKKVAQEFFKKSYKKGDIYFGDYEGLYCYGCEEFKREIDLVKGLCPYHQTQPSKVKEKNYFFKLSKYEKKLLNLVNNKDFILPKNRRNEIITFVKSGLNDISVSRPNNGWGIEVPFDKSQSLWVWYDALFNYKSGVDKKYWKGKVVHLVGKDIQKFHTVTWPAMLLSVGESLPTTVFSHGFFTVNGQKISKSLGNAIDPIHLANKYGVDTLRFYLIREIPFGQDGDFSEESLIARHNNELANDLGNLVSRVLTLAEKNFPNGLKKSPLDKKLISKLNSKKINSHMQKLELQQGLNETWKFVNECNKHINDEKPWEMKGKELEKHLYTLTEAVRIIAILTSPFVPETSEKIFNQLGQKNGTLKDAVFGKVKIYKVKKSDILFKKIEAIINVIETNKIKEYSIDPELKKQGINVAMVLVSNANVSNKDSYLKSIKEEISQKLQKKDISNKKILDGYKEFYVKAEVNGCVPAPENLINVIQKNKSIPNINTVVDCYNVISAETLLSFGAHDTSSIKGSISFRVTGGSEKFIPLGEKQPIKINKGEYAFMDDEEILCRMDIKQCDKTKIKKETRNFVLYVQGNKYVDSDYLKNALEKACKLLKKVCGGSYEIIPEKNESIKKGEILFKKIEMKEKPIQPEKIEQNLDKVDIDYFKKIDLRVAKIKAVSDHPNADKLYLLVLDLGKGEHELQVLSGLKENYTKEDLLGKRVVVIRNLKHAVIRGIESQGMLLAAVFKNKVSLVEPDSDIEIGAKVM